MYGAFLGRTFLFNLKWEATLCAEERLTTRDGERVAGSSFSQLDPESQENSKDVSVLQALGFVISHKPLKSAFALGTNEERLSIATPTSQYIKI